MKAVIFAGGVGTRLWPLSRKKSPKQFEKIINGKSTLQLTVERISSIYKLEDIYIATSVIYKDIIRKQFPLLPKENIFTEPVKRDSGPAVGLAMKYLDEKFPNEPVLILWSDHLIKHQNEFLNVITAANEMILKDPQKIIFLGQKARFANENLGWIEVGDKVEYSKGSPIYAFQSMRYKPNKELAEYYFKSDKYCWNLGYFVSTPHHICSLYRKLAPEIYSILVKIFKDRKKIQSALTKQYSKMSTINFDNAILEKLDKKAALVIYHDIGWSDIGAWDAFKEALEKSNAENVVQGNVVVESCIDNLVCNLNEKQTVVCIDLNELLVVNTPDAILVAKKSSIPKLKKVVEGFEGSEFEYLA